MVLIEVEKITPLFPLRPACQDGVLPDRLARQAILRGTVIVLLPFIKEDAYFNFNTTSIFTGYVLLFGKLDFTTE
jgi:hypothetical protein